MTLFYRVSAWKCAVSDNGAAKSRLDASLLTWAATVVRNGRHVFDQLDVQSCGLQRSDCAFATRARAFDADFDVSHAKLGGLFRSLLSGALASKRRALAASLEAGSACRCPAQRITLGVGDRYGCVVER